jgi:hypothetical protein
MRSLIRAVFIALILFLLFMALNTWMEVVK